MPLRPRKPPVKTTGALAVIEEATHLLRQLHARQWLPYVAGSSLFLAVLLWFWSEMARAPDAFARLLPGSLALAAAYAVMKLGHAVFGRHLLARLTGEEPAPLPPATWLRIWTRQVLIHATMPWVLGVALLAAIPFAWVFAFYHNTSILAFGQPTGGRPGEAVFQRAAQAARHAPYQNHVLVFFLFLLAFLLWLNLMVLAITLPGLLKSLSGIETAFSRNPWAMLNSTLLVGVTAATWMMVSPFFRAAYAVRCFESGSRRTGADIRAALRRLPAGAAVALVLALGAPQHATAAPPVAATVRPWTAAAASPARADELDQALDDVLDRAEFRWRLPRERPPESKRGWLDQMVGDALQWLGGIARGVGEWIGTLLEWILGGGGAAVPGAGAGAAAGGPARVLMIVLILLLVGALLFLIVRWIVNRREPGQPVAAAAAPAIDLDDESLTAADLPEDEWLRLAAEMSARGDLRLALRALFLGSLARLGERGLVAITPGKTNGMYQRELGRRAAGLAPLRDAFAHNVGVFERVWYGRHAVTPDTLAAFRRNHDRITHVPVPHPEG